MTFDHMDDALTSLEKANAELNPDLLPADAARELLAMYARAGKLVAFGEAVLARRVDDAAEVARAKPAHRWVGRRRRSRPARR